MKLSQGGKEGGRKEGGENEGCAGGCGNAVMKWHINFNSESIVILKNSYLAFRREVI